MPARKMYEIVTYGSNRAWDTVVTGTDCTICVYCYGRHTNMAQCGHCGVYRHSRCSKQYNYECPLCGPEVLYGP